MEREIWLPKACNIVIIWEVCGHWIANITPRIACLCSANLSCRSLLVLPMLKNLASWTFLSNRRSSADEICKCLALYYIFAVITIIAFVGLFWFWAQLCWLFLWRRLWIKLSCRSGHLLKIINDGSEKSDSMSVIWQSL